MELEKRHYILIGVAILVILFLWTWDSNDTTQEQFSVIPEWPYMPPKYWKNRNKKHWKPWYFYDNTTEHPAVPSISNYDTEFYRFPNTNCLNPVEPKKHMLPSYKCHKPAQMKPYGQEEAVIASKPPKQMTGCHTCGTGNIENFEPNTMSDIDDNYEANYEAHDGHGKVLVEDGRVLVEDSKYIDPSEGFSEELADCNPLSFIQKMSTMQKIVLVGIIGIIIYYFVMQRNKTN